MAKKRNSEFVKMEYYTNKGLKTNSKEVEGERCLRGSDGNLCFSEKESLERLCGKEQK